MGITSMQTETITTAAHFALGDRVRAYDDAGVHPGVVARFARSEMGVIVAYVKLDDAPERGPVAFGLWNLFFVARDEFDNPR